MLECSAYNFYPKQIKLTWLRNGQEVTEGVSYTDVIPDGQFYYQSHSYLEYAPTSGERISCMVEHSALSEPQTIVWGKLINLVYITQNRGNINPLYLNTFRWLLHCGRKRSGCGWSLWTADWVTSPDLWINLLQEKVCCIHWCLKTDIYGCTLQLHENCMNFRIKKMFCVLLDVQWFLWGSSLIITRADRLALKLKKLKFFLSFMWHSNIFYVFTFLTYFFLQM